MYPTQIKQQSKHDVMEYYMVQCNLACINKHEKDEISE